tara:strand:+ start:1547 stop:2155 length:609 start_codon:yes stop_codon:yes gene_type:complete
MKGIIFTLFFVAGNVESVNIGDNFGARFRLMKNKYNENKKFYMNDINSIYNLVSNSTLKSRPCYHYSDNNIKKTVRVNYKIAKKYSNLFLNKKIKMLYDNQNEIIDKTICFVSDNLINELLYLFKIYHLSNDNTNSYIYIIIYESIWISYKVIILNRNNKNNEQDVSYENSQILFQQLLINIIIYIAIKNIFLNTLVKFIEH